MCGGEGPHSKQWKAVKSVDNSVWFLSMASLYHVEICDLGVCVCVCGAWW